MATFHSAPREVHQRFGFGLDGLDRFLPKPYYLGRKAYGYVGWLRLFECLSRGEKEMRHREIVAAGNT